MITDVAVDLLGPDVKFHHSKLNFKAPRGGEEVKWHQDIQFWPHTNYDLLTIGVFLEDVEPGMGEVGFVPGSHDGPLFDLYDGDVWVGALAADDVVAGRGRRGRVPGRARRARSRCTTAARCTARRRTRSDRARPLLLQTYAAADAFSYTDLVTPIAARRGADPRRDAALGPPRPAPVPPAAERAVPPDLRGAAARALAAGRGQG